MASSILTSEPTATAGLPSRQRDRFGLLRLTILLAVLFCAIIAAWAYVLALSPEVNFFAFAARKKIEYALQLDQRNSPKVVIYGGSSCGFGVNTDYMNDTFHLRAVNFGLHAGIGAPVLTGLALKYTKPGDTLILSLEPQLLNVQFDWPALGDQISYALWQPDLCEGGPLRLLRRGKLGIFLAMRPGAENILRFLPRELSHVIVIYPRSGLSPSGWQRFDLHASPPSTSIGTSLSPDAQMLLEKIVGYCLQKNIKVAYAVPWMYCDPAQLPHYKSLLGQYLFEISRFVPVLKDPTLGIDTNPDDFADTNFHLTASTARRRSAELAKLIIDWKMWDSKELADQPHR